MLPIQLEFDESFFKEDVRDGFCVTAQRKKIWAVELDLLAKFDQVCRENQLKYFIDGGTLLGAVRHHGFIPWDDDIDVVMLREDYDRLLKIAGKAFQHPYFFQSAYSDIGYVRGHSQLRNSETCGALPREAYCKPFNQGIFLDVFVLDGITENPLELEKQFQKLWVSHKKMLKILYPYNAGNSMKYVLKVIRKWIYMKFGFIQYRYRRFEKCAKQYSDSPDVYLITFYKNLDEIIRFKREWYSEVKYLPFEMMQCPVPAGYDHILKGYYGEDYMTPMQVDNVHGELILDTERSYKEVLEQWSPGWQTINGDTYYLNRRGQPYIGDAIIDGAKYTFSSNGKLIL